MRIVNWTRTTLRKVIETLTGVTNGLRRRAHVRSSWDSSK